MPKKYPNKAFSVPSLVTLAFSKNFAIRQIGGCWFQVWQYLFQIPAQKYRSQGFLVGNLGIFVEGTDYRYDNIVLKFESKNTQIRHF